MSDTMKMTVATPGLTALKKELALVAPDLKNELTKVFRNYAKTVATVARSRVQDQPPMRGWRTTPATNPRNGRGGWIPWDASRAKAGIIYKAGVKDETTGKKTAFGYRVVNASPQGAIIEFAGKRSGGQQGKSNNPNAGSQFILNLNVYGSASRLIWKAYDQFANEIQTGTVREVERITNEYETRLNTYGGIN